MEIQSACAMLETQIDSFKKEAAERWGKSCLTSLYHSKSWILSVKLKLVGLCVSGAGT